jgi:hypothetical protein
MKKQILVAAALFLAAGTILTSCKKDEEAPVITLTGGKEQSFNLGEASTDPGATVADNEDSDLKATSNWASVVKANEVNTYEVTYTAEDKAGNQASEKKTVKVKSDLLAGTYTCTDIVTGADDPSNNGTFTYTVTVTQSSTAYNKLIISNMGGFGTSVTATVDVLGTTFTLPSTSLSVPGVGSFNISGNGNYNGADKKLTSMTYSTAFFGTGNVTMVKQ